MKKTTYTSLLTIPLLMTLGANSVYAAETNSATTDATATIVPGDDTQDPTPPITGPTDPGDNTGNKGPLTLDYASHFDFGDIKLSGQAINQSPVNKVTNEDNEQVSPIFGAQVTDTRGTGAGWNLNVSLSSFAGTKQNHVLKGAKLVLPKGTAMTNGTAETETTPTTNAVTLNADGQAASLFTAAANQGMGSWFDKMAADQIKLQAPNGQYADTYTATITWSLQDTPPV